ncbi:hypothetical protein D4R54_01120 [archaeon]|nr:MAG: hypothetical protein D4R54_01120 [archaeon]
MGTGPWGRFETKPGTNAVHVIGKTKADLSDRQRSSATNSAGAASTGLGEAVLYLPTIDDQATLDKAAEAALAAIQASRSKDTSTLNMNQLMENIILEVVDKNPTGAYNPEDQVTITSPTLGLSGLYKVKRIERNMSDPYYAKLDLTTRRTEYWELDENMRRTVRNLNTLV